MKIYIDLPVSHPEYEHLDQLVCSAGHQVSEDEQNASFTMRLFGYPTAFINPKRLIIVGDFSISQEAPVFAICIDRKTKMVQMPGGQKIHWRHYSMEWLDEPVDMV